MPTVTESFIFGAANSLHCAGMCGPLALCFRGGKLGAAGYHAGRVAAYAVLGAIAGAAGTVFGADAIPSGWISLLFGTALVLIACGAPSLFSGGALLRLPILGRVFARARTLPPAAAGLSIGLVTPLLPCGVLYVAAGSALVTGDPSEGAATLAVFALGALPALLLTQINLGLLTTRLGPEGRARLFRGLMILAAGVLAYRGIADLTGSSCH